MTGNIPAPLVQGEIKSGIGVAAPCVIVLEGLHTPSFVQPSQLVPCLHEETTALRELLLFSRRIHTQLINIKNTDTQSVLSAMDAPTGTSQ